MMIPWQAYLIDLDGTLYHGNRMIEGADTLISELDQSNIPYLFVTNNSSRTARDVADSLRAMGIKAEEKHVCTSAMAAAQYIADLKPGGRVAPIGEVGLLTALEDAELIMTEDEPDFVVQGIDRNFTYAKLARAVEWIHGGAQYVLTNPDLLLPSDKGLMPGAGSISASITAATGANPVIIGKPSSILMNYAMERLGLSHEQVAVIGDNMLTDITAGDVAGCGTILVLTGITTEQNLDDHLMKSGIKRTSYARICMNY